MIGHNTGIGLFLLVLFCFLLDQNIRAQTLLQGIILNEQGQSTPYISVVIRPLGSSFITAFGVSDMNGRFKITVNHAADSLDITASSLHYSKQTKRVKNTSQELVFKLEPDVKLLETFTVRASPIERKGDTISYLVQSFAGEPDRSIEDVLRRMPGIEVEPSGRILYQGLPIQKYYVEGLDLMDGRYVAVSSNMPHTAVSTVEILENHQPLRILEDRVSSQQASLNIKLKNNITTTGTAKLGGGYGTSMLWDANMTPMAFTKNFQLLGSYQANNTGQDVAQQLKAVGFQDLLLHPEKPLQEFSMLNIQRPKLPLTEQNRFLFNNIHLINLNGLLRLKRDLQLRANVHYVNDFQHQKAITNRQVYSPADTLAFTENITNRYHDQLLRAVFTISRNIKENYLINKLSIESGWDSKQGSLFDGFNHIEQNLNKPVLSISNEFRTVYPIGKKLVEFSSFALYDENSPTLLIRPGVFEGALNSDLVYDTARQHILIKRVYAHHSMSFLHHWKGLFINPSAGLINRSQNLESNIFVLMDGNETPANSAFANKIEISLLRPYVKTGIEYKRKGLTIKTDLPLSYNILVVNDSLHNGHNSLFFEPKLSMFYQTKGFWQVGGSYFHANRLGNLDEVHDGFVLRNYNTLFRNPSPHEVIKSRNISFRLSYRNPINAFFNSVNYVYGTRNHSVLYSNQIQSDGQTEIVSTNVPNKGTYHNLHLNSSKYISASRSTISLKASYSLNKRVSLLNNEMFDVENRLLHLSPQLNTRITAWFNSEYRFEMNQFTTKTVNFNKNKTAFTKHHFNFYFFPGNGIMLSLINEKYVTGQQQHLFSDLRYRHRIKNKGLDLELHWSNIFNAKTYTDFHASTYTFYENTYFLRPTQLIISLKWNF
jgi:hypothetical protein